MNAINGFDPVKCGDVTAYCASGLTGPLLTPRQFLKWCQDATAGEQIAYFKGDLAFYGGSKADNPMPENERRDCRAIGSTAFKACEAGLVRLTQKRFGFQNYVYLATRRERPSSASKLRLATT